MVAVPPAVILVNNDLLPQPLSWLVKQLHINETISGAVFDQRIAANPNYISELKALDRRLLVVRDFREENNRDQFDVVIFVKNGLASVEQNNFGPPCQSQSVLNLHWGQLSIFE